MGNGKKKKLTPEKRLERIKKRADVAKKRAASAKKRAEKAREKAALSKKNPPIDLDNASVRGTKLQWHGQEEWVQELRKEGFTDFYSAPTKGDLKKQPIGTTALDADEFGKIIKDTFPSGGPDLVAVDHKKKRILVGDITARSSTTANFSEPGGIRRQPNDLEDEEFKRHHLEKTKRDASRLSRNLPEQYKDYDVHFQDRYTEDPERKASKRFRVRKTPSPPDPARGTQHGTPTDKERGTETSPGKKGAPKKTKKPGKKAPLKKKPAVKPAKKNPAGKKVKATGQAEKKAAGEAEKKAARKAAEKARKKAAEEAAEKAAKLATKEAERKAVKEAKEKAAEKASELAKKKAADAAAKKAAKEAADKAAEDAAKKAAVKNLAKAESKGFRKLTLKLRPKIKAGLFFLLEIGLELFTGWLDSKRQMQMIADEIEKNSDDFQKVLDREDVQDDFIKFRSGNDLEKGYQLYFYVKILVKRTCSDGGCGVSGRITEMHFKSVDFARTKGHEFFPDPQEEKGWGYADGEYGAMATFNIPIFEKGEPVHIATEQAADEDFSVFNEEFIDRSSKAVGNYTRDYFDEFRKYALMFPDSEANVIYNLKWGLNDPLVNIVLVELGRKPPLELLNPPNSMAFHEIIEKVRWGLASKIGCILEFYKMVLQLRDEWQIYYLELYDKYFRLLDTGYTKCSPSCHRMTGDKRIIHRITATDIKMKHKWDYYPDPVYRISKEEEEAYENRMIDDFIKFRK